MSIARDIRQLVIARLASALNMPAGDRITAVKKTPEQVSVGKAATLLPRLCVYVPSEDGKGGPTSYAMRAHIVIDAWATGASAELAQDASDDLAEAVSDALLGGDSGWTAGFEAVGKISRKRDAFEGGDVPIAVTHTVLEVSYSETPEVTDPSADLDVVNIDADIIDQGGPDGVIEITTRVEPNEVTP